MEVGGSKVDDHLARLQAHERRQGIKKKRVKRKPKAEGHPLGYMLDWYRLIRAGIGTTFGYEPMSHQEIESFNNLYGMELDVFDVETLRRLDTIWLKSRPKREEPAPRK